MKGEPVDSWLKGLLEKLRLKQTDQERLSWKCIRINIRTCKWSNPLKNDTYWGRNGFFSRGEHSQIEHKQFFPHTQKETQSSTIIVQQNARAASTLQIDDDAVHQKMNTRRLVAVRTDRIRPESSLVWAVWQGPIIPVLSVCYQC